jgi:asparagine synthase (glutamine-hydrolysing)
LTRRYVTVVLNGDGADESFAGYDWYKMDRWIHRGRVIPLAARQRLAELTKRFPATWKNTAPVRQLSRLAEVLALAPSRRYAQWVEHFSPVARRRLYTSEFSAAVKEIDPDQLFDSAFARSEAEDWLDTVLEADVHLYLADDLLVKMERATMANSLEARSPFLDHRFMEFAASLAVSFKQNWGQKKRILKASLHARLPDDLLHRAKMGFSVPLAEWFREDLQEVARDALLSPRAFQRGYFAPDEVARVLDEHSGLIDHGVRLWDLLMLELWHRQFVDGPANLSPIRCCGPSDRESAISIS